MALSSRHLLNQVIKQLYGLKKIRLILETPYIIQSCRFQTYTQVANNQLDSINLSKIT